MSERMMTKWEAAAERIGRECLPFLMAKEHDLQRDGHRIVGAILPAHLDPGPYDGEGATDVGAQIMGYPVTWGSQTGFIVAADSHLARVDNLEMRDFS